MAMMKLSSDRPSLVQLGGGEPTLAFLHYFGGSAISWRWVMSELRQSIAIETHTQTADSAWRWWLLEGMKHSIADQMDAVQIPVTVLASQADPVIPLETIYQDVMAFLPHAKLVEIPEVGHLMPLEASKTMAQEIRRAVRQRSPV